MATNNPFAQGSYAATVGGITPGELGVAEKDFVRKKDLVVTGIYKDELLEKYKDNEFVIEAAVERAAPIITTMSTFLQPEEDYSQVIGDAVVVNGDPWVDYKVCAKAPGSQPVTTLDLEQEYTINVETVPAYASFGGFFVEGQLKSNSTQWKFVAGADVTDGTPIKMKFYYTRPSILGGSIQFDSTGAAQTLSILSNENWTVIGVPDWMQAVTGTEGSGNATLTFTATANHTIESKSGSIVLSGANGATTEIQVAQSAAGADLEVSPTSVEFGAEDNLVKTLTVTGNVGFTVTVPKEAESWLTAEVAGNTITLTADARTDTSANRSTTVVVASETGGISRNITVVQLSIAAALSVNPTSLSFTSAASSKNIDITCNEGWTITGVPAWLELNATEGSGSATVEVEAIANTSITEDRSATLVVKSSSGLEKSIAVTQSKTEVVLTVSPAALTFGADSNLKQTVTVTSNDSWTLTVPTWLTASKTSGTGNGSVELTATARTTTGENYTGTVNLTSGLGATASVSVQQYAPGASLIVSPASISFTAVAGQTGKITVTCNESWNLTAPDWVTVNKTSGSGNDEVTVTSKENVSTQTQKEGSIAFTSKSGNTASVAITQAKATPVLTLNPTSYTFGAASNLTKEITVTCNEDWAVTVPSWLKASKTSGSGNGSFTLTATARSLWGDEYSGTVTVKSQSNVTKTVSVKQSAPTASITASSTSVSFGAKSSLEQTIKITSNSDWTVGTLPAWVASVSPTSGSASPSAVNVKITAKENASTTSTNSGSIKFTGQDDSSVTVNLSQSAADVELSVSATSLSLGSDSDLSKAFTVTCNEGWTAAITYTDGTGWASLSKTAQSAAGATEVSCSATARELTVGLAKRSGKITITSTNPTASKKKTATITFEQAAPSITGIDITVDSVSWGSYTSECPPDGGDCYIRPYYIVKGSSGTTKNVYPWDAADGQDTYLIDVTASIASGDSLYEEEDYWVFEFGANPQNVTAARSITFTAKAPSSLGLYQDTITLKQTAYTISASPTSMEFTASGGSQTLTISSNGSWTIS